jgi:MOSC domain-containing protein YiiM
VTARLLSVNVVHGLIPDQRGGLDRTAIDKRPTAGLIPVQRLGAVGDRQYDQRNHGGPDKALYAYAREDLDAWEQELGRELTNGQFGENLTTAGLDVTGALIGERWRIGGNDGVEVEVTMPRIPCSTFQGWIDEPQWVRRFFRHGAPGAYLRVLSEGTLAAGDEIEVVHRPAHGVGMIETFLLRDADAERLSSLLEEPDIAPDLAHAIRRDLAARATRKR